MRSPIVEGVLSGPEDDGVVMVLTYTAGTWGNCSGSLVAPNLVLTARHCVSGGTFDEGFECNLNGSLAWSIGDSGKMGATLDPKTISICTGTDCTLAMSSAAPAALGAEVYGLVTETICQSDIAAVKLDRALDLPIVPVRLSTATFPNETVRGVGYGTFNTSDLGSNIRYARSGISVKKVAASALYPQGGQTPPGTFVVGPGPCRGDSGGPALSEPADSAKKRAVVGVYSIVGLPCDSPEVQNVYTQVAVFRNFLLDSAQKAGVTLTPEEDNTAGTAGAGGAGGAGEPAGSAAVGGSSEGRRGLRKKSGCTCNTPGGAGEALRWLALLPLVTFGLCRRRIRPAVALRK